MLVLVAGRADRTKGWRQRGQSISTRHPDVRAVVEPSDDVAVALDAMLTADGSKAAAALAIQVHAAMDYCGILNEAVSLGVSEEMVIAQRRRFGTLSELPLVGGYLGQHLAYAKSRP
jgi:hypothetical protein